MADSKQRPAAKPAKPDGLTTADTDVLDPPPGQQDVQADLGTLGTLRAKRDEAVAAGDGVAAAHLDNLIREAERLGNA
jgi:hypothetical protein